MHKVLISLPKYVARSKTTRKEDQDSDGRLQTTGGSTTRILRKDCLFLKNKWRYTTSSFESLAIFLQKQDPAQFLRVYGRPIKIHWDHSIALAAESPQSMYETYWPAVGAFSYDVWFQDAMARRQQHQDRPVWWACSPWLHSRVQVEGRRVRRRLRFCNERSTWIVLHAGLTATRKKRRGCVTTNATKFSYRTSVLEVRANSVTLNPRLCQLVSRFCCLVSESQCLQQIYVDEMYGSQDEQSRQKEKEEEKKKWVATFVKSRSAEYLHCLAISLQTCRFESSHRLLVR